jgi:hypothetical protein
MTEDRATVLLKAVLEILEKCDKSAYVLDVMSQTAFYDGTDCDAFCLMEDIKHHLDFGDEG